MNKDTITLFKNISGLIVIMILILIVMNLLISARHDREIEEQKVVLACFMGQSGTYEFSEKCLHVLPKDCKVLPAGKTGILVDCPKKDKH